MTYSPIPANQFTLDVLPSSMRSFAVATFAAACASRLSNHPRTDSSSGRIYSSTPIVILYSNLYVTRLQVPRATERLDRENVRGNVKRTRENEPGGGSAADGLAGAYFVLGGVEKISGPQI